MLRGLHRCRGREAHQCLHDPDPPWLPRFVQMTRDLRACALGGIVRLGTFVALLRLGRRGKPRLDLALNQRRRG